MAKSESKWVLSNAVLIYSWIIHWFVIQWAVLKINKKYPFRNARFAPLSMRRGFGAFLITLVVVAYTMTREALRPEVTNKELPRNSNGISKEADRFLFYTII